MKDNHVVIIDIHDGPEGHAGVWPNGEPGSVRAEYDRTAALSTIPEQVYDKKALLARGGNR